MSEAYHSPHTPHNNSTTQDEASENGFASEARFLADVSLRCVRQAGLVVLLDRILKKEGFDWRSADARLSADQVITLYKCVRLCFTTCAEFFHDSLSRWRVGLSDTAVVEQVRRGRSKALLLNIAVLFDAYAAESKPLRELARLNLIADSHRLIHLYITTSEVFA